MDGVTKERDASSVHTHSCWLLLSSCVCVCVCGSRVTWHNKNGIVFSTTQQTHFMLHIYRKDIWPPPARIDRQPTKGSHRLTLKSLLFFILYFSISKNRIAYAIYVRIVMPACSWASSTAFSSYQKWKIQQQHSPRVFRNQKANLLCVCLFCSGAKEPGGRGGGGWLFIQIGRVGLAM
jgi:hypothetical protein